MMLRSKAIVAAVFLLVCLGIHTYSTNETRVETGYSSDFSPWFSGILRYGFGKIPFSIGDIFYGLLVFWMLWKVFKFLRWIFQKKGNGQSIASHLMRSGLDLLIFSAGLYVVFNVFWGINYDRKGIAWQLGLDMKKYSEEDLAEINCLLIDKINRAKRALVEGQVQYPLNKNLYAGVVDAYTHASRKFPFLEYHPSSIKTSMWGWLGNYTGFTGYYNPFTGEAQLNTTVPKFLQPFIGCHEAAHQLGYAKEMEANFVGYLAASASSDPLFHYSVYLDLFTYANRNLFIQDSTTARLYRKELDTAVVADIREWMEFNRRHRSVVEPVIRWIYGKYLQGNRQPQGILSYDEVTAFLISYYKKFGKI